MNKLGKVTFFLTCIFTILFVLVRIYAARMFGIRYDGWDNIIDMSRSIGNNALIKMIGEYFVIPIICCIVCLIYLIKIGQNKKINRFTYIITAMAILVEMFFYIFTNINSVSVLPLLFRSGFLLAFVLLYIDYTKNLFRKIIYVIVTCPFIATVIYIIIHYINTLTPIRESVETLQGTEILFVYLDYLILPALGLIVSGAIILYIIS